MSVAAIPQGGGEEDHRLIRRPQGRRRRAFSSGADVALGPVREFRWRRPPREEEKRAAA
jgi:hypothetical protein